MGTKALLLDRDGVLNKMIRQNGKWYSPHRLSEFELYSGMGEAVRKAKSRGFLVMVVTNQPDIRRGFMKPEELEEMHSFMKKQLSLDDIFVCAHDNADNCDCRKPKPGLVRAAIDKWNIDPDRSFVIGDRWKDIAAGHTCGCKTVLVRGPETENEAFWSKSDIRYDRFAENLTEAVEKMEQWTAE